MKTFLSRIVDGLGVIGDRGTRVGLVVFGDNATVLFDLDRYTDKQSTLDAINNAEFRTRGRTNMEAAINTLRSTSKGTDRRPSMLILCYTLLTSLSSLILHILVSWYLPHGMMSIYLVLTMSYKENRNETQHVTHCKYTMESRNIGGSSAT